MSELIRTGLIRCDTHGMWFGPQMQEHDPVLLERPLCFDDDRVGKYSWMTRGCHYFFYTHYSAPRRMTAPRVEGFEIVKLWDEDRDVAELAAKVFKGKPTVCDSFEEVSDEVDLVFIADCNGDGSDHLKLATPGLRKRVPTFIDKPFALSMEDVRSILDLARQNATPVMSLSILQTNPATARIRHRLDELGKTMFGTVTCAVNIPAALIHAISTVHNVFGTGIQTVSCLKTPRHTAFHLDYGQRPDRPTHGVVISCGVAQFRFTEMFVSAYGPEGAIQVLALDDYNASDGSAVILEHVKEMVRTRRPHPLGDEMITGIAVMDAARESENTGKPVAVAEIGT
ncbi:MAG: Gfo/Idh/MocA family oxidoreductase [Planctomycetes bacterium]|nr:Gfo/Idh/MocA family oxidoreductase [Planctomycetota bacterium]